MTTPALEPPCPGTETWIPTALALGLPTLVAEGAPADPVNARTAMNPIRIDCRPATWSQIIRDSGGLRHSGCLRDRAPAAYFLSESENHYHLVGDGARSQIPEHDR